MPMILLMFIFMLMPSVKVATSNDISMTMSGSLIKVSVVARLPSVGITGRSNVVMAINPTGSNDEIMLFINPGNCSSGKVEGLKISSGFESIFFNVLEKMGPAMITEGIATMMPYSNVF